MLYKKTELTVVPNIRNYMIDTNGIIYGKLGRQLHTTVTKSGYEVVNLTYMGYSITKQVHRLVALQFLPNPENKPTVNHIDGVRNNNVLSNLEWASLSEQQKHSFGKLGRKQHNIKTICGKSVETGEVVYFESCAEAARRLNKRRCTIDFAIVGKKPSCAGYVWIKDTGNKKENEELLNKKLEHWNLHRIGRKVGMYSYDEKLIKTYKNVYSTRLDGFCYKIIQKCCSKSPHYESQKHKGYIWRFL